MIEITVDREYDGMRLDRFVTKNTEAGRNTVQKLLRKGDIRVNGVRTKSGDTLLREGDTVRIYGAEGKDPRAVSFDESLGPVDVLYEDGSVLAVNKPALLASQPMQGRRDCLSERIKLYLKDEILAGGGTFIPAPVNRLDYGTSGIVLCGKTPSAARALSELLREEKIGKRYYALCFGEARDRMRLEDWAKRDEKTGSMRILREKTEGASRMLGIYSPVKCAGGLTLMEAQLITGKTHQIRCQLSHAGYPLVNDGRYGDEAANAGFRGTHAVDRLLLHCFEVDFPLWYAPGSIKITCPVPEDMKRVLNETGLEL